MRISEVSFLSEFALGCFNFVLQPRKIFRKLFQLRFALVLDVCDVTTLFNLCQLKFRCLTHGISCEVYDIYHIGFSGGWEGECSALETQTPAPPPPGAGCRWSFDRAGAHVLRKTMLQYHN